MNNLYNYIVNLFSEDDYSVLLEESSENSKTEESKILVVPPEITDSPFLIKNKNLLEEINENPRFSTYSQKKKELLTYFNFSKFVNPTHNNSNNIGSNSALMSHSPSHYKIYDTFINKDKKHPNGNLLIEFPLKKVDAFKTSFKNTEYFNKFPWLSDKVANFFKDFEIINPENKFGLKQNDYVVFIVNESEINDYLDTVNNYTNTKILKYLTFKGNCDNCGNTEQLYMLTQGNMFDLGKGRKFLLRHPTRYKTNIKSESPENFNICNKCAKNIYNFFEYIKKNKFYRYVFPTAVSVDKTDYKDYSSKPLGILKMLKNLYHRTRFNEFDYIMMMTDPEIENIEFRYINNFNYILPNENPKVIVGNIPISSKLKDLDSKGKDEEIIKIKDERDKTTFLMELNLLYNNALMPSLFETDPKKLIKSLHPFLKLKIIEYNSIIRNYIYFQDVSLFEDRIFTKLFIEILSELVDNQNLRDQMKIGNNKMRFFLTIYFKYLNLEPNGGGIIKEYFKLNEKMQDLENIKLENDFEASYSMGQIFYYLLQVSKTENRFSLFTKYTMNVHNMDALKQRLIAVLEKYSHNEYIDNNRGFHSLISNVLAFEFKKNYEDNKIPMYTGYFDNNHLYVSKKEKEELEFKQQEEE
ncbi:Uncharacterised protein [uncultured archaeon]|nr:Uncharacterised protein [uncultured archaeon]